MVTDHHLMSMYHVSMHLIQVDDPMEYSMKNVNLVSSSEDHHSALHVNVVNFKKYVHFMYRED